MQADQHPTAPLVPTPIGVGVLPGTASAASIAPLTDLLPRKPGPSKTTMRVGVAIVGLALLGVAAVVAVPRHTTKQPTVASRSISLPPTLVGEDFVPTRDTVQQAQQQLNNLVADFAVVGVLVEDPQQGGYENKQTSDRLGIIAVKLTKQLSTAAQNAFFATEAKGYSADFLSVGPGPYGGQMQCVDASSLLGARCVSIDDAAIIVVQAIGPKTLDEVANLTRQIISGIEH